MTGIELSRSAGVLCVRRAGTRWIHTGWDGGRWRADRAYSVTVPAGWRGDDIEAYVDGRLERAGFPTPGPTLLTGVEAEHARVARVGPAVVVATAGLSNPAWLPMDPNGEPSVDGSTGTDGAVRPGTVNLIVIVDGRLVEGARLNALAMAAEAKAATLLEVAGVPGTTSDAIVLGDDVGGQAVRYSGSATPIGAAIRAGVRDAVLAALEARYRDRRPEAVVRGATEGVETTERATISPVEGPDDDRAP